MHAHMSTILRAYLISSSDTSWVFDVFLVSQVEVMVDNVIIHMDQQRHVLRICYVWS